jgi:hypothetical protein
MTPRRDYGKWAAVAVVLLALVYIVVIWQIEPYAGGLLK